MNLHLGLSMVALIANGMVWSVVLAQGTPPGFEGKPLPIYPAKPTDCYVLLKNQWPYVRGGDYPVCRAVLDNFNKYCGEPPQYDIRKIHPTTSALHQPSWEPMSAKDNPDLIKQTIMAQWLPKLREERWQWISSRIEQRIASSDLQFFRADISSNVGDEQQTVYRIDNAGEPDAAAGYNQPSLMITAAGQRVPVPIFKLLSGGRELRSDLWSFRNQWFLVNFDPIEKRFHVKEVVQPRAGPEAPVAATPRCTLQHIKDHQGGR